jgi:uncharacterized protein
MSEKYVKDPRDVVKTGDLVKVKVMDIDLARHRIALSMRLDDSSDQQQSKAPRKQSNEKPAKSSRRQRGGDESKPQGAMAAALKGALKKG